MWTMLRTNRDLRLVFAAQVISYLGDWFAFVALAGFVEDATDSELLVSLVLVSFALPLFLAAPLGGAAADRLDRRKLLVAISAGQALAATGLLLTSEHRIWPVFVFQGLVSGLAAFVRPCIEAAIPNLVRDEAELRKAATLFGSTWGVMLAVGAGLGGLFSHAFGRRASIVADVVTFAVAGLLITLVRQPLQGHAVARRGAAGADGANRIRPIADMREAISIARQDSVVLALLCSKATFGIGAGVVSQLAVLSADVFKTGDRGLGLLLAARGVGSGLGPFVAARWTGGSLRRVMTLCGWAALGFSATYAAAAWSPSIAIAVGFVFVAHFGGGANWTLSTYGLQRRVDNRLLGRIMAGDLAINTLVLSVTSVTAGLLATAVGVQWAITAFAGLAAVAGTVYLVSTKSIRQNLAT
jgi:MFS family permease